MKTCEKCQLEYSEASGFCPGCEDPLIETDLSPESAAEPVASERAPGETVEALAIEAIPSSEPASPPPSPPPSPPVASVETPDETGERSPLEAIPSPEPAPPPAASAVASGETCPGCHAAIQPNWKFCKFCGHRFDESTVVRTRPSDPSPGPEVTVPQDTAAPAPQVPAGPKPAFAVATLALSEVQHQPYVPKPGADFSAEIAPAFRPTNCPACGHENYAGRATCESCSIALVPVKARRGGKKVVMIAGIAAGVLLALALVAAGGLYFLGSTVTVQTNPADATILIDGREVGRTDAAGNLSIKRVRPGNHSLVVKKQGFADWNQSFSVSFAAFQTGLSVKLEPVLWKLTLVTTPPGSSIYVDDKPVGTTDFTSGSLDIPNLTPGDHSVVARLPGYVEWKQTITLSGDQKLTATLTPETTVDPNSPEGAVRSAVDGWLAAMRNRGLDQVMGFYGEVLTYYQDRSAVPKGIVRPDYEKLFAQFSKLETQQSNLAVQMAADGNSATVTFDNMFNYSGDGNAKSAGSRQMQLTLTKTGAAWLITGEKKLKDY